MPLTVPLEVSASEREVLVSWTRSPSMRGRVGATGQGGVLAAEGVGTAEIVRRVGMSKPAVIGWKRRYAAEGVAGLDDRPKPGRPRLIDPVDIVLATLEPTTTGNGLGGDALGCEPAAGQRTLACIIIPQGNVTYLARH